MRKVPAIATAAALMILACPAFAQTAAPRPTPTGLAARPSTDPSLPAMASRGPMTPAARIAIVTAVRSQLQPCADRQIIPAPEAGQIVAVVQLNLNRDGSLASVRILGHQGVTESNQRYVSQVDNAVEAIFAGCTPFHGLPPELYDVPNGWRSMKFLYRLKA